jgi:hypothetical protein
MRRPYVEPDRGLPPSLELRRLRASAPGHPMMEGNSFV